MSAFHRFIQPAYDLAPSIPTGPGTVSFNGVPYSFINVVSGGVGASGSAFADAVKSTGPNTGSFFVSFGEDATSSNANRGMRALAENTDYLDDVVNKALAMPVRTTLTTAGGTVFSIALPTGTFVGNTGAYPLDMLFSITDENDNELITSAGVKIVVVSISGASVGGGFSSGTVTCTVSPGISAGVQYRMTYAVRSSLATLPVDAFSFLRVRGAEEVPAAVEQVFRTIQSPSAVNLAWNATPQSTIWDLAASGLNGRYRRSTSTPGVVNFNTAGDGAVISRDGQAVTSRAISLFGNHTQPDPFMALWLADDQTQGSARDGANSGLGSWGFVSKTNRPFLQGEITTNANNRGLSLGSFGEFVERQQVTISGSPGVGTGYATKIPKNTAATIGFGGAANVFLVTLPAGAFFFATTPAGDETAIQVGRDVLIVTIGGVSVATLITDISATGGLTAFVITLDGGTVPTLTPAVSGTVACTVTWYSARFTVGFNNVDVKAELDALSGLTGIGFLRPANGGFFFSDLPTGLTTDVTDSSGSWRQRRNPQPTMTVVRALPEASAKESVIAWGENSLGTGNQAPTRGTLYSDGSVGAVGFVTENNTSGLHVPSARNTGFGFVGKYLEIGDAGSVPGLVRATRYGLKHAQGSVRVIQTISSDNQAFTADFGGTSADPSVTNSVGASIPQCLTVICNGTAANNFTANPTILLPLSYAFNIGEEITVVLVARNCRAKPVFWGDTSDTNYPTNRSTTLSSITYTVTVLGLGHVANSSAASPVTMKTRLSALLGTSSTSTKAAVRIYKFTLAYVGSNGAGTQQVTWVCTYAEEGDSLFGTDYTALPTATGIATAPHV